MISLRKLLFKEDSAELNRKYDIWRVDSEDSSIVTYGARNTEGDVRYFTDEETAREFARGKIKGPHPGRPEPKIAPNRIEKKQTYKTKND